MAQLQQTLRECVGKNNILRRTIPDYITQGLNPRKPLRPYQQECFRYLMAYMEDDFDDKPRLPHLLFHMATGSGKTLLMAACILYYYNKGYRNFLFFVNHTNIVEKTRDNFLNSLSAKYLFAQRISIGGRPVEIKEVSNFQGSDADDINLCLTTIQGLHADLNSEKENALTFEDFADSPIVLISDEAHHLNTATRKGKGEATDDAHTHDWESSVMRIFHRDSGSLPNVMLEFTATMDLANADIAHKYEDKLLFDYTLKQFRQDRYSKDVETVETDGSDAMSRVLPALLLSQLKRKLFAGIGQDIKPVVLLKSKTIADNKRHFDQFKTMVASLSPSDIDRVRTLASKGDLKTAFDHFDSQGITADNLILELQADFAEERLLLVDGNNISADKQRLLNSLEQSGNGIRAIFAVDMLNEGWDVLNLFDIVRLYDTRDSSKNVPGKTTMQEAQLIGRGARYMPFRDPKDDTLERDRRKYDADAGNVLRIIEKLHYHCAHNPRYIQELHAALVQTGAIEDKRKQLSLFLKESFKESALYRRGLVFLNDRQLTAIAEDDGTLGQQLLERLYSVRLPLGIIRSGLLLTEQPGEDVDDASLSTLFVRAKQLGRHILRAAMNRSASFSYSHLHTLYPSLRSCREFAESDRYLANLQLEVRGHASSLESYRQEERLYMACSLLQQLEPLMNVRGRSYRGTTLFRPKPFRDTFRSNIVLNIAVKEGGDQEFGESQRSPKNAEYALDLEQTDWYAYNDNFGTSEEKALVKFMEAWLPRLREKYSSIYLVRNEKDVRVFDFAEGRPFEPDFVLFMRVKGQEDRFDNLQIFIEPKGEHLMANDQWKQSFLLQVHGEGELTWFTKTDKYAIYGLPFFNESADHKKRFSDNFLQVVSGGPNGGHLSPSYSPPTSSHMLAAEP